jgi:hypothetical protein
MNTVVKQRMPGITAMQWLGKQVSAAKKNCRTRRFLCGLCRFKGTYALSSSKNILFKRESR